MNSVEMNSVENKESKTLVAYCLFSLIKWVFLTEHVSPP